MSKLSVFLHRVADLVTNAVQHATPEQQQPLNDASAALKAAAQATEAALPVVVKLGVDALLVDLGWGVYVPDANGLLDAIAAEVLSRKKAA